MYGGQAITHQSFDKMRRRGSGSNANASNNKMHPAVNSNLNILQYPPPEEAENLSPKRTGIGALS